MVPRRLRIPFFRIWYSSTYSFIFLCALILLAVTPADLIYQSVRYEQVPQGFTVGIVTIVVVVVVVLIYTTRIYTNRTTLAAIPKTFIPIEAGEVSRHVRRLIVKQWHRSALVAWDARPRDLTTEDTEDILPAIADSGVEKTRRRSTIQDATAIEISIEQPPWGHIEHLGWSSPSSADLPGLYYGSVISELPNLLEAKAVSLAPPDPVFAATPAQQAAGIAPIPDERAVTLLRRSAGTGVREYLGKLASLNLVDPPELGAKFLDQYESARFSASPLTDAQFRSLMDVFGDLLGGMAELDPDLLAEALEDSDPYDNDALSMASAEAQSTGSGSVRKHRPAPEPLLNLKEDVRRPRLPAQSSSGLQGTPQAYESATSVIRYDQTTGTSENDADADFASVRSRTAESVRSDQSVVKHHIAAPD